MGGSSKLRSRKLRAAWKRTYALRFLTLLGLGMALAMTVAKPGERALRAATEWLVLALVPFAGLEASDIGGHVILFAGSTGTFAYRLVEDCAGLKVLLFFGAAVAAYPAPARQRLLGLAVGLPSLVAANVLRLVHLAVVGVQWPAWFPSAHDVGWPVFQLGSVVVLTAAWMRWAAKGGRHSGSPLKRGTPPKLSLRLSAAGAGGLALMFTPVPGWYAQAVSWVIASVSANWFGALGVSVNDGQLFGRPRFLALWIAGAVVFCIQPRHRAYRPVARITCIVVMLHLVESLAVVVYGVMTSSLSGVSSSLAQPVLLDMVQAAIFLVVLREIRRARPSLLRPVRLRPEAAPVP